MQEKELEADYEIGVVLGNGGFGTVYAGTRRRDGKRVSVRYTLLAESCELLSSVNTCIICFKQEHFFRNVLIYYSSFYVITLHFILFLIDKGKFLFESIFIQRINRGL